MSGQEMNLIEKIKEIEMVVKKDSRRELAGIDSKKKKMLWWL